MKSFHLYGAVPRDASAGLTAGAPRSCAGRLRERSRLEWRTQDSVDPAALIEDFLADSGVPVRNLAMPAGGIEGHHHSPVCGATLFLSAAAGAYLAGAPARRASPAAAVPDVAVVVWGHGETGESSGRAGPGPEQVSGGEEGWIGPWRASWTPARHAEAVARVREAIARGDVYQVNVVGHASAPYLGDPAPALRRVAGLPGARYAGILRGAGWAVACASPETLVEAAGGTVTTRPIKGTAPATAAGRAELSASAKEHAEHIMIVDLERNDLARLARTGTVRVDELYAIRRWCNLWQAESVISATLVDGTGLSDLLRAVCPGGSVTGAPKRAALALIDALEPVGRGASMGALGWVGPGRVDLGLTIRTVAVDAERMHLWAGGGITWGSEPRAEVAEADAKAAPLRAAIGGVRTAG